MRDEKYKLILLISEPLQDLYAGYNPFGDSGTQSSHATDLARRWLQDCLEAHPVCQELYNAGQSTLPTRVLDVLAFPDPTQIRLYTSNSQIAPYVCLSHCWGKEKPYVTTLDSLKSRETAINVQDLPSTFRDAVKITRDLGFRYLWIDSLCIIQDSREDWRCESARMGRLYQKAVLTIAASGAKGDTEGCFMARSGASTALWRTPMFDGLNKLMRGGSFCATFIQRNLWHAEGGLPFQQYNAFNLLDGRLDTATESSRGGIDDGYYLDRRGWTLQESMLSTRWLEYMHNEIQWRCPTKRACECVPEGTSLREVRPDALEGLRETPSLTQKFNPYASWRQLIHIYSKRDLTYDRDKLPAFSGLAAEMTKYVDDKYLAGIWLNDLRNGLAWHLTPYGPARNTLAARSGSWGRPSIYRAPSWSWASVNGIIRTLYTSQIDLRNQKEAPGNESEESLTNTDLMNMEAQILSCWTTADGPNPYGEVSAGELTLRGMLKQASVSDTKRISKVTGDFLWRGRLSIFDDETHEEIGGFEPDGWSWNRTEVWCMPLLAEPEFRMLRCLALSPIKGNSVNEEQGGVGDVRFWQRAGMIWMFHNRKGFQSDGHMVSPVAWFAGEEPVTVTII